MSISRVREQRDILLVQRRPLIDCAPVVYDTIRYDSGYLTCGKKLTGSQLSLRLSMTSQRQCAGLVGLFVATHTHTHSHSHSPNRRTVRSICSSHVTIASAAVRYVTLRQVPLRVSRCVPHNPPPLRNPQPPNARVNYRLYTVRQKQSPTKTELNRLYSPNTKTIIIIVQEALMLQRGRAMLRVIGQLAVWLGQW